MKTIRDHSWQRKGFSLLWNADLLMQASKQEEIVSLRKLLGIAKSWPEELPSQQGNVIVVAGLDGALDLRTTDDAEAWLEKDLHDLLLSFQDEYEMQAGLIFWLPGGDKRVEMETDEESYYWNCEGTRKGQRIALSRSLFGGAQANLARILESKEKNPDTDGTAWKGLHLDRLT